ncbi:MAG: hypothetical protein NT166_19660 [Candidatus Aminicenantes bacterium]|nr:hypothetical protein [Candidatus Aminicenantes bacterium]
MKKENRKKYCARRIFIILIPLIACFIPLHLAGEIATIPGNIDRVCLYTDFFYNDPSHDFFYFLNDRLLFMDKPDGKLAANGLRNKLLKILRRHNLVKKSIQRYKTGNNNLVIINVDQPAGYENASILLNLLGLRLEKTPAGEFNVSENTSAEIPDYFRFAQLDILTITKQLNQSRHFYFKFEESEIPVPWDYGFLRQITGLELDAGSFFETLLKDEKFSLLLGALYRLTDSEIDYIGGLLKDPRPGAWQQIYNDKKFLMGMFLLSGALRTADSGAEQNSHWLLPGGSDAEPFWSQLAGKDAKTAPLEFLYQLAVKDDGKLNYFYLFSFFLAPETQKALFVGENAQKMVEIYNLVVLEEKEKLSESQFPQLRDAGFFTFLYTINTGTGPGEVAGADADAVVGRWWKVIAPGETPRKPGPPRESIAETGPGTAPMASVIKDQKEIRGPLSGGKRMRKGRFYLKVAGGAEFLNGGDYSRMTDTNERSNENLSKTRKIPFYWSYGGELGYSFKRFSAGIEVSKVLTNFTAQFDGNDFIGPWDQKFFAIPVLLNLHFKLVGSPTVNVYLNGGGGAYFGQYRNVWRWKYKSNSNFYRVGVEVAKKRQFGFHLGGTIELAISKGVFVFLQGRVRFVKFSEMYGKGHYIDYIGYSTAHNYEGDLYYLTYTGRPATGFFLGPDFDKALASGRKALLNMTGPAISLGIKFNLGK